MEAIHNEDRLLRRVQYLHPSFIKPDGTPTSASFSLRRDEKGLSVDLERLTIYSEAIQDRSRFRLYALKAGYIKSLDLENVYDPKPDNPAHSLIIGNISKGISRKLATSAVRIAYPD